MQREMEKHIQILGVLYIVVSVMGLMTGIIALIVLAGVGAASGDPGALAFLSGLGLIIALFMGVLSLPGLLGGYGLIRRYPWSRLLVTILNVLNLFNFPLGTALGIYGLWVLAQQESAAILERRRTAPYRGQA